LDHGEHEARASNEGSGVKLPVGPRGTAPAIIKGAKLPGDESFFVHFHTKEGLRVKEGFKRNELH